MHQSTPEIPTIICGSCMIASSSILNPNAFPEDIEKEVRAAVTKLSLFLTAKTDLMRSLEYAREDMYKHLNRNWAPYKQASATRKDAEVVAYSDGLVYMSNFNMFLYELKSFLDIFSPILCRLVSNSTSSVHGFNKGNVDGRKISGGKLINWVRNLADNSFENKNDLSEILLENSTNWINEAVKYRDDLAHYKGFQDLRHMRISITNGPTALAQENILDPVMPNGKGLVEYSNETCEKMGTFIEEVLKIVPNVKNELNSTWEEAKKGL